MPGRHRPCRSRRRTGRPGRARTAGRCGSGRGPPRAPGTSRRTARWWRPRLRRAAAGRLDEQPTDHHRRAAGDGRAGIRHDRRVLRRDLDLVVGDARGRPPRAAGRSSWSPGPSRWRPVRMRIAPAAVSSTDATEAMWTSPEPVNPAPCQASARPIPLADAVDRPVRSGRARDGPGPDAIRPAPSRARSAVARIRTPRPPAPGPPRRPRCPAGPGRSASCRPGT